MRSPWSLVRRIDSTGRLWRSKIGAPSLTLPLALVAAVSAPGLAESQTLNLKASWPGQYDTAIGWYPHAGFPPVCAASADPGIAVTNGTVIRIGANFNYGTYYRNGTSVFQDRLANFFGNGLLPDNTDIGPPALLYDNDSNRLVMVDTARQVGTEQAWITVGTTAVSPPYGGTTDCTFRIDANIRPGAGPTNQYADHVQVGMNADSILITADMYKFTNGNFKYSKLWVFPKSAVYNVPLHSCPVFNPSPSYVAWDFTLPDGSLASHVVPAKSYDPSSSVSYLLSAPVEGGNQLGLWTLDTASFNLKGASVPVKPFSIAPLAAQKATSFVPSPPPILTGDSRLVNAVYQPNSGLWTVHTTTCPWNAKLSCFKWYEIDPNSGTPRQDSFFGYNDSSVFAPAVAVSRNAAVFAFNSSSSSLFVNLETVGRYAGAPTNALGQSLLVKPGSDVYTRGTPAYHSGADTDPTNDNKFWVVGAYASGPNTACPNGTPNYDWATEVGSLVFR